MKKLLGSIIIICAIGTIITVAISGELSILAAYIWLGVVIVSRLEIMLS
jgi:hypothetical protein